MKRRILLLTLPVFLFGFVFGLTLPRLQALPEKVYKSLDLFTKVLYIIEKDYVENVDGQDLVYGAIKGMLGTLDPYSVFLTPDVYKELKIDTVGRFGGVGLEITLQDGVLTVVSPIEDTPAARAGIQSGDRIVKINGKTTKGMNLADAVRRMRGSRRSKVKLTIYRKDVKKPFDVTLNRDVIKVKSVKSELLKGDIAFLRITSFQEQSTKELKKAIEQLKAQAKGGEIKAFIIDMRNNPGGLLEEAVSISDMFLDKGTIVSTKGRIGLNEVREAKAGGDYIKAPMVILLNGGSASASEIVAAALRDNNRGKIIGTKSFGKGSVQTVMDLGDDTGLKLTIAKYYTPAGVSIAGTGIQPDFEVKNPKGKKGYIEQDVKKDRQRKAAIAYLRTGKIPKVVEPVEKKAEKKTEKKSDQPTDLVPEK